MTSSTTFEPTAQDDAPATRAESAAAQVAKRLTRAEVAASLFGEAAPVKVGRFELGPCIGRGAMGKVYQAFDGTLERTVALKIISGRPGVSAERLLDEARALARLEHPNVVTIHEAGVTDDGVVYCAMALLEGVDLRTLWRASPSREEVLATVAALASALGALHESGVVHRDVKPENVMMVDGRPVLVDFGVARQTLAAGGEVDRGYPVAGTPGYMAPEQRDGAPGDSRSDQFALAMMTCEGLFGVRPPLTPAHEAHELGIVPPPDVSDEPVWPPLARALSRAPHERFPTVLALADALARAGAPVAVETPIPSRRNWTRVALVLLVGLALYLAWRASASPVDEVTVPTSMPLVPVVPTITPRPDEREKLAVADPTRADPRELIRMAVDRIEKEGPPGAELVAAKFLAVREGVVDATKAGAAQIRFEWIDPADPGRHGEATVAYSQGTIELSRREGSMFYRGRRFDKYLPLTPPACALEKALAAAEGLEGAPKMVAWGMRYARSDEGHLTWHIYDRLGTQWHVDAVTCSLVEKIE